MGLSADFTLQLGVCFGGDIAGGHHLYLFDQIADDCLKLSLVGAFGRRAAVGQHRQAHHCSTADVFGLADINSIAASGNLSPVQPSQTFVDRCQ